MTRDYKIVIVVLVGSFAYDLWMLRRPKSCPACLHPYGRQHRCNWVEDLK